MDLKISSKTALTLVKDSAQSWTQDKVPILGAALSYYTIFSIAPLLIITIAIAGLVFGQEAARGEIVASIQGLMGKSGAEGIEAMIQGASAQGKGSGIVATVIGVGALLFGASGVFGQLQTALNMIWNVEAKPTNGILQFIRERFLSFAMILVIGFLLLVSLALSAALAALGGFLSSSLPGGEALWQGLNFALSFGVITALFALMFKYLPDAKIAWKDVWIGAAVTAFLFTIGKFAIGLYLGNSAFSSSYGAAGSILILLTWVYYSSMILFFGAEFTRVYANRFGSRIKPAQNAVVRGATPGKARVTPQRAPHLSSDSPPSSNVVHLQSFQLPRGRAASSMIGGLLMGIGASIGLKSLRQSERASRSRAERRGADRKRES